MAKKTTRRPRVSLGDKPTPPPKPTTPRKPRSTSAKQAGQAAKKVTAPRPKPAPKPKPSLGQAIKQSAIQAAKSTIKFTPAGKAAAAIGAGKVAGTAIVKRASGEIVKRPGSQVVKPVITKPRNSKAIAVSGSRSTYSDRLGPMATGTALLGTGVMATRNPGFGANNKAAAPKKKTSPTYANRRAAEKRVATSRMYKEYADSRMGKEYKKLSQRQFEWRTQRRWGQLDPKTNLASAKKFDASGKALYPSGAIRRSEKGIPNPYPKPPKGKKQVGGTGWKTPKKK